jgi:hypothetical protein
VILSVVGQNERWAHIDALEPPPAVQSGQNGEPGSGKLGTPIPDPAAVNSIAGNTTSPLSSNMNLMLTLLGGGLDSRVANGAGLNSGSGAVTTSPDDQLNAQSAAGSVAADPQSLVQNLTGAGFGTSATASGVLSALSMSNASIRGERQLAPPSSAPGAGQTSYQDDIMRSDAAAAVATWGNGPSGPGGGWQEKFARAAYQSGSALGPNSQSLWQNVSI